MSLFRWPIAARSESPRRRDSRGRSTTAARRHKMVRRGAAPSPPAGRCRFCLQRRHLPPYNRSQPPRNLRPVCESTRAPAMLSAITVTGMRSLCSSQAVRSRALQKGPRLVGDHRDLFARVARRAYYAERRTVSRRRQRSGVTMRQHSCRVPNERRAELAPGHDSRRCPPRRWRSLRRAGGGKDAPRRGPWPRSTTSPIRATAHARLTAVGRVAHRPLATWANRARARAPLIPRIPSATPIAAATPDRGRPANHHRANCLRDAAPVADMHRDPPRAPAAGAGQSCGPCHCAIRWFLQPCSNQPGSVGRFHSVKQVQGQPGQPTRISVGRQKYLLCDAIVCALGVGAALGCECTWLRHCAAGRERCETGYYSGARLFRRGRASCA